MTLISRIDKMVAQRIKENIKELTVRPLGNYKAKDFCEARMQHLS